MSALSRDFMTVIVLAERELLRFLRQRNRVFGALAQPVFFWLLFGAGLSASFAPSTGQASVSYLEYFFPGTIVLIVLFTAIFSTISIIEDRSAGFLQSVLVAPVSPTAIVAGKLLGITALAVGQGALIYVLAPLAGLGFSFVHIAMTLPLLIVIGFGLSGLGFAIAWRTDSTQGFHAIMTAFLMPMWFLSGAFFPASGVPVWLGWLMTANPLTYGMSALRRILYLDQPEAVQALPGMALSLTVTVCFTLSMVVLASIVVRGRQLETS